MKFYSIRVADIRFINIHQLFFSCRWVSRFFGEYVPKFFFPSLFYISFSRILTDRWLIYTIKNSDNSHHPVLLAIKSQYLRLVSALLSTWHLLLSLILEHIAGTGNYVPKQSEWNWSTYRVIPNVHYPWVQSMWLWTPTSELWGCVH